MANYYWRYIGCPTNSVPQELLSDQKLNPLVLKELLKNIATKEGILQASDEETVVRLLFNNDIFPIRIKRLSKKDIKIINLKKIQRQIHPSDEKVNVIIPQNNNKRHIMVYITLLIIILIAVYLILK